MLAEMDKFVSEEAERSESISTEKMLQKLKVNSFLHFRFSRFW